MFGWHIVLFFGSFLSFFLTQMLTDLLRQLVGSGVRIVTLDHHLREPDFVKSGEVCNCWHRDSHTLNISCTLWCISKREILSLPLSLSHTQWPPDSSIEHRISQGKKIPTTVTMNYVITLLSQDYCIISRLFYLKTSVPAPLFMVTSYLSRTVKGYEWWLDNLSRGDTH